MMKGIADMARARLYVTTREAYALGERFGQWMEVCRYQSKQAFMAAFRELHPQEKEPELLILDWQDIPRCLASGEGVSCRIFRFAGYVSQLDAQRNRAFHLWLEEKYAGLAACRPSEIIRLFALSYQGYYPQEGDFGKYYAGEMLAIPVAANPGFDYVRFEQQLLSKRFIRIGEYIFSR